MPKGSNCKNLDEVFKGTDNIYIVSIRQVVIGKATVKLRRPNCITEGFGTVIQQPQQKEIMGK